MAFLLALSNRRRLSLVGGAHPTPDRRPVRTTRDEGGRGGRSMTGEADDGMGDVSNSRVIADVTSSASEPRARPDWSIPALPDGRVRGLPEHAGRVSVGHRAVRS